MQNDIYRNGEYLASNPTFHVEDSPWKARQILKMLRKHELQSQSVCEIGCGAGEILRQLQGYLPEATFSGYDISPQAIDLARARAANKLHFFCADLLETNTKPFDLLLCIDVFEHVDDYLGFLRKLRPYGRFMVFHIPLDMTVSSVLRCRQLMKTREGVGHLHYFMKETALATLKDTGYNVVDYFYTPGYLGCAKKIKTYLAILPRMLLSSISQDFAAHVLGGFSLLVLAKSNAAEPNSQAVKAP